MNTLEILRAKRDGKVLTSDQMRFLIEGFTSAKIPDYQMSAFLMAVFQRGMTAEETRTWTRLMWKSGVTLARPERQGFWIDKHSTGGVGDKTSLILVPLVHVAATNLWGADRVRIPMVSGRGLDFSGGTLDKLESVPGFSPSLEIDRALELLEAQGFFMMGQTKDLAPADRLIYALRDVTATVECLPLIVSSILSKKLAENLDGLVLDVKFGQGAFMQTAAEAKRLAQALVETASAEGVRTTAVLTSMQEPLGWAAGHEVEVAECAQYFRGEREPGLHEVVLRLASEMLVLAAPERLPLPQATQACEAALASDAPLRVFKKLFESQGGNWNGFEKLQDQPLPRHAIRAPASGTVAGVDARGVGMLLRELGGGRQSKDSVLDPRVGVLTRAKIGARVEAGDTLLEIVAREPRPEVLRMAESCVKVQAESCAPTRWIEEVLYDG